MLERQEVSAQIPEEPPVGTAVLSGKGVAYQRTRMSAGYPEWLPAGFGVMQGMGQPNAEYWSQLLLSGPLLVLTDEDSFEWVKKAAQERARKDQQEGVTTVERA